MLANINIKTDFEVKKKAELLFEQLGMNMTTAINIFLRQTVRQGCIPFEVTMHTKPNAETAAALAEARHMMADPNSKAYSVDDALKELKA